MEKIFTIDEIKNTINPILQKHGVERAYLFGSYARKEATGMSDIDLRIDGGSIQSMFGLGALYDELVTALNKSVDLVTTEALNHEANLKYTKRFKKNIQEDELLIYEKEEY